MTNGAGTGEPPAGDPVPQPQPTPQPPAGTQPPSEPQAGDEPISLEEARKLRSEARNLRERMRTAEATAKELTDLKAKIESEKLSETERLQKQFADLQQEHDDYIQAAYARIVDLEVRAQAAALGINPKHLERVARFIDASNIEPDDNGQMPGIREALEQLIKDMPELVTRQAQPTLPTSGGATNPSRAATNTTSAESIVAAMRAGTLKADEYARLDAATKREVQALMGGRR